MRNYDDSAASIDKSFKANALQNLTSFLGVKKPHLTVRNIDSFLQQESFPFQSLQFFMSCSSRGPWRRAASSLCHSSQTEVESLLWCMDNLVALFLCGLGVCRDTSLTYSQVDSVWHIEKSFNFPIPENFSTQN